MTTIVDRRLFGFAAGVWVASLVGLRIPTVAAWLGAALAAVGAALLVAVARSGGVARAVVVGRSVGVAGPVSVARSVGVSASGVGTAPDRTGRASARARYRPRHHRPVAVWAVAGVLLGAVCGFAATAARTAARDGPRLAALVAERTQQRVRLRITGDPRRLAGGETLLVPAVLTEVAQPGGPRMVLDVRVLVFARDPAWEALLPSQAVWAQGRLGPSRGGDLTAAVLSADGPPERDGGPQWTQSAAGGLRAGLRAAVAAQPARPGGLLPALSIGDTSLLDPALEEEFRATGLTHLAAVSGANITIVVGFVLLLARWSRAGPSVAGGLALVALIGFVILVRPSPSVVRAAAMGAVGLLALVVGRSRVATSALATAVVASLLVDPALAVSAGFLLSVVATGALVLIAPGWRDRLRAAGVPTGLAEALAIPAAAQVACAPIIAAIQGEVSLVALPANLLAAPAVAPVTVIGVAAAAVSAVSPDAASVLAWVGCWPARWLVLVAQTGAAVPAGVVGWASGWPGAISLAALCGGVILALRRPASRRIVLVVALAVAAGTLPVRWLAYGWPSAGTVVVACDVGQGDAIVLPDGDGSAVLVDTGPEPEPVDACLRRLRITVIDAVVISHFHADHVGGLAGVLRGRGVGGIVVPAFDEPVAGREQVRRLAAEAAVPVVDVRPGWTFNDGDVELRALGPTRLLHGTRSDPNNNSLVLVARVRGVSVLLTGDSEVEQQAELVNRLGPSALRADVLKVPHHGSSYQDSRFLDATHARVALVSVGTDNPYGHPDPGLLRHLRDLGMRVERTDERGDIAVVVTGGGLGVVARDP